MITSQRVGILEYLIRELVPVAKQLEAKGKKILYLNIGDPLKYDFETPKYIREALKEAIDNGYNYYSKAQGIDELLEAIAEKERKVNNVPLSPDRIVVTTGVSEAINFVMATLVEKGDKVLLPSPTYPLYANFTKFYGGKPVFYRLCEENNWMPDLNDIRSKIDEKTKILVIINPNNPTGGVYSRQILTEILDLAAQHNLIVVSDEIYDRIVFEEEFYSTASLSKDTVVIGLNGFSKTYLMTGWRLGYVYIYDPMGSVGEEVYNAIVKMAMNRLCAPTPIQIAAAKALRGSQKHITDFVLKLKRRRDMVMEIIAETDCLSAVKPRGAFYIFPRVEYKGDWKNDKEFAYKLLIEEGVLIVPGTGFYTGDHDHFRTVILPPADMLNEAFDKIVDFIERHKVS
ncbi:MAG: alanine aminotransferase [Thermoprotei archaeon]|nr:MAG: alanine aminotransferase [Thermoprotei archaeon]